MAVEDRLVHDSHPLQMRCGDQPEKVLGASRSGDARRRSQPFAMKGKPGDYFLGAALPPLAPLAPAAPPSSSVFTFFFFFIEIFTTRTLGMPRTLSPSFQRSASLSFSRRSARVRTLRFEIAPALTFKLLSIGIGAPGESKRQTGISSQETPSRNKGKCMFANPRRASRAD